MRLEEITYAFFGKSRRVSFLQFKFLTYKRTDFFDFKTLSLSSKRKIRLYKLTTCTWLLHLLVVVFVLRQHFIINHFDEVIKNIELDGFNKTLKVFHDKIYYKFYLFIWCDSHNLSFQNVQSLKFKNNTS